MENLNQKKVYWFVDVVKLVCAVLVICIHTNPLSSYSKALNFVLVNYFARIAVPFYFITSGYFLFRKTDLKNFKPQITLNWAKRIFSMYLFWTIIYFPLSVYSVFKKGENIISAMAEWLHSTIVTGSYTHLWYLNASVVSVLLLTFLLTKKISVKGILLITVILYCMGLLGGQSYFWVIVPLNKIDLLWFTLKWIQKIIITTRNGIFEAPIFMSIGMILAHKSIKINLRYSVLGFVMSLLFYAIEVFTIYHINRIEAPSIYIGIVPASFFLFCLSTQIQIKYRKIFKLLRPMSILIYLSQYYSIWIAAVLGKKLNIYTNGFSTNSLGQFVLVVIIVIIISVFIVLLSQVKPLRWLKKLY